MKLSSFIVIFALLVVCASAFIVEVAPKSQECFFEDLEKNERLIASYEVLAGGMLDINIKVIGPDSKTVYEAEREQEGSFQFAAIKKGVYQVCFNNAMSTMTSKVVTFNIYAGSELHKYQNAKADHMQPLDRAVMGLTEGIRKFVDTYHYIRGRILTCHNTAVSTNSRVFWWGFANIIILIVSLALKIILIKRPFEKKNFNYQPM